MYALGLVNAQTQVLYETSLTIMNEGPHCDLTDWKHGYSEWMDFSEVINSDRESDFPTPVDLTRNEFPKVDMKELEKAATEHCDEFWGKHSRKCKDPNSYPCGVGASKVWFKVTRTDKKPNKKLKRSFLWK